MINSKYKSLEPDWIFYGGTFDPPHLGHMDSVRIARDLFVDSEIVLVPAFAPPVSKDKTKDVASNFADRVAMCVVAFDEWSRVQISALEEDLGEPSFTVRTLRDLRGEYPNAKLAWMIGADQLAAFLHWNEPKEILKLASLIVLPRSVNSKTALIDLAENVARELGFLYSTDREFGLIQLTGANNIWVLDGKPAAISSSDFREVLASDPAAAQALVCPAVFDYVNDLALYNLSLENEEESP